MARSRYKFFDDTYNEDFQHTQKGLPNTNIGELFSGPDDILYNIPLQEEFRPDRISIRFFGDPTLYWVLVYVNNISNSPAGFTEGKTIRVPQYDRVIGLL